MAGQLAPAQARFCPDCGQPLPRPGAACATCPPVDAERRAILADYRHQLDRLRAVDAAENAQLLTEGARRARRAVRPVQEGTAPLRRRVAEAVGAERLAEDRYRDAQEHLRKVTRAEEKARRDQAGPAARTEALLRIRAAADVAQGDKAAAEGATAARRAAQLALDEHLGRLAQLEDAAVTAEWAAEHAPAKVPPSIQTALFAHPMQLLALPDLGGTGREMVRLQILEYARLLGLADELRAEGHAAGVKEHAERVRNSPLHAVPAGDGTVAAIPNITHPATPQQSWAPGRTA